MKKQILYIVIFLFYSFTSLSQETKKVLFIGNSYTFYNDLPGMVNDIATSLGDSLIFDSSTPGGFTFQQHSTNAETMTKINSDNWDYVILQEQSQLPSFSPTQVANECLPYAEILTDLIYANDSCTEPMFFMTWGRKNGDQLNCQYYPPVCTYEGMQQRLRESYLLMGQLYGGVVAPVGATWQQVRINNLDIELYSSDESHPSLSGSYLAACVFYSSIFQKSPVTTFIPTGLNDIDAIYIQNKANEIVFDSLDNWSIDTTTIYCNFDYDPTSEPEIQFINLSENANSYSWDFGDGIFSTEENPIHQYSPGQYEVILVALKGCDSDTFKIDLEITLSIFDDELINTVILYPNPAEESFKIISKIIGAFYKITDIKGRAYISGIINSRDEHIDTSELAKGIYIFSLIYDENTITRKLVIQ